MLERVVLASLSAQCGTGPVPLLLTARDPVWSSVALFSGGAAPSEGGDS